MPESVFTHTIPLAWADRTCPFVAFFTGGADSSVLGVIPGGTKDCEGASVAFLDFLFFVVFSASAVSAVAFFLPAAASAGVGAGVGAGVTVAEGASVDLADFFFFFFVVFSV